ncbi:MAG TPA: hypothetical protein VFA19_05820 [Gaiellaceae bacterium]|nr:hypothetical protein [Gaiellaceae bacterium]
MPSPPVAAPAPTAPAAAQHAPGGAPADGVVPAFSTALSLLAAALAAVSHVFGGGFALVALASLLLPVAPRWSRRVRPVTALRAPPALAFGIERPG